MIRYPIIVADAMALRDLEEEIAAVKSERAWLSSIDERLHDLYMALGPGWHSDVVGQILDEVREKIDACGDEVGRNGFRQADIVAFGDCEI